MEALKRPLSPFEARVTRERYLAGTSGQAFPQSRDYDSAKLLGGHVGGVTPVPIPNTAVKPT